MAELGEISLELLDPQNCNPRDILSMAETYREVYRTDSEWLEEFQCPNCRKVFGPTNNRVVQGILVCNGCAGPVPLVEMWTIRNILMEDFYGQISQRENFVCSLARLPSGRIIGFCWGYLASAKTLEKKTTGAKGLARELNQRFGQKLYAYQKEAVVLPEFQRHGLGSLLIWLRNQAFATLLPNGIALFQTLADPPSKSYHLFVEKIGYQICHRFFHPEEQRQKIFAAMTIPNINTIFSQNLNTRFGLNFSNDD
ncbi:MAG: hypothetical protein NTV81_00075 [Candidatus Komeilibacteria bacterium]|nr:hypothetical protein [Candidatus Komeilibacteria bacterium]